MPVSTFSNKEQFQLNILTRISIEINILIIIVVISDQRFIIFCHQIRQTDL